MVFFGVWGWIFVFFTFSSLIFGECRLSQSLPFQTLSWPEPQGRGQTWPDSPGVLSYYGGSYFSTLLLIWFNSVPREIWRWCSLAWDERGGCFSGFMGHPCWGIRKEEGGWFKTVNSAAFSTGQLCWCGAVTTLLLPEAGDLIFRTTRQRRVRM